MKPCIEARRCEYTRVMLGGWLFHPDGRPSLESWTEPTFKGILKIAEFWLRYKKYPNPGERFILNLYDR